MSSAKRTVLFSSSCGSLLFVALCFSALGCYDTLDPHKVACRVGTGRNCPSGYQCRAPEGRQFGSCCRPEETNCGEDSGAGRLDVGGGDSSDTPVGATPDARETGEDNRGGRFDGVGFDVAADVRAPSDADSDVPLGGAGGAGGFAGNTGAGGSTGVDAAPQIEGGRSGTGGTTVTTGGVRTGGGTGTGGAQTGGSTGTGGPTGGVSGTGGGQAGGVSGTGGSQAGGVTGTGGSQTGGASGSGGQTGGVSGTGGDQSGGVTGTGGGQTGGATGGSSIGGTGGSTPNTGTLITSADGDFWQSGTLTESPSAPADLTVDSSTILQTWEGFGGAFNERGWSYLSTSALQSEAMQLLFGSDGCRLAWGRIPMGASDYAMSRYTDDETDNDTTMASFSITRDQEKLIPYIKEAKNVNPELRFWASPWTPPTWMKTGPYSPSSGPSNSPFDGGVMKGDAATLSAYALYFVKFVQAYAGEGINIESVAPQNEPNYEQNYPSCRWSNTTFVSFIGRYLGPALATAGLTTRVMNGTLSNPTLDAALGSQVLQDATAKGYIGTIGVQWGMTGASQISTLKTLAGTIPIWVSETKYGGVIGSTAPAPNDFNYAKETWGYIRDAIKNGVTAYNAWNMVLDKGGLGIDDTRLWPENALLVVDAGKLIKTPAYYVYRHFSQLVRPGAKVLQTAGGDAVAFQNPDGSLVAVVYNSGAADSSYVVAMDGKKLQFAMPANGWATVKW